MIKPIKSCTFLNTPPNGIIHYNMPLINDKKARKDTIYLINYKFCYILFA